MTFPRSLAAKRRFDREGQALCPACHGSGRVLSPSVIAKAKRGGNACYLASMGDGQLSMSERGRKGGRPKELTLEDFQRNS